MQCGWTHPLLYLGLHAKVQKSQFSSFNVCVRGCRERTTLCVHAQLFRFAETLFAECEQSLCFPAGPSLALAVCCVAGG